MKTVEEIIKIVEDEIKYYDELSRDAFLLKQKSSSISDKRFYGKLSYEDANVKMAMRILLKKIVEGED